MSLAKANHLIKRAASPFPRQLLLGVLLLCISVSIAQADAPDIDWEFIAEHPHDSARFTQGMEWKGKLRLESSGGFGRSFVVLEDGEAPPARFDLPKDQFAEGATFSDDAIWLLTWRAGIAYKLNQQLQVMRRLRYAGEGWGLAHNDGLLYMSNGSDTLQVRDAVTFKLLARMPVREGNRRISRLNELEYACGLLWANIFGSDRIAAIDPDTGEIRGWLDGAPLAERLDKPTDWDARNNVLNGIAFDAATGHLHITGKHWPKRFELRLDQPQIECTQ